MTTVSNLALLQVSSCLTPRGRRLLTEAMSDIDNDSCRSTETTSSPKMERFEDWWQSTHSSAVSFAFLQGRMMVIANFLRGKLLDDHMGKPYSPPQFVIDLSALVASGALEADEQTAKWRLADATVRQPVRELDLDLHYVRNRLLQVAQQAAPSANDLHGYCSNRQANHELFVGDRKALASLVIQGKIDETSARRLESAMNGQNDDVGGTANRSWFKGWFGF